MPRSSPFTITLSSAEEAELRRRAAKYTLPYFQVQRARMILHAAAGMANHEIAERLDTRREVVSLWRKRFFADRLAGQGRSESFPPRRRKRGPLLFLLRRFPYDIGGGWSGALRPACGARLGRSGSRLQR